MCVSIDEPGNDGFTGHVDDPDARRYSHRVAITDSLDAAIRNDDGGLLERRGARAVDDPSAGERNPPVSRPLDETRRR